MLVLSVLSLELTYIGYLPRDQCQIVNQTHGNNPEVSNESLFWHPLGCWTKSEHKEEYGNKTNNQQQPIITE